MLDKRLLEKLSCPLCKGSLEYKQKKEVLICENCKIFFPIIDEIPDLRPEASRPLKELETSSENSSD